MKRNLLLKTIAMLLALVLCVFGSNTVARATPESGEEPSTATSGTCGDNLTWVLDEEGMLTISGTGEMEHYQTTVENHSPWGKRNDILKVIIEDGVTAIGNNAFYDCWGLKEVVFPESLVKFGWGSFERCSALDNVRIPSSVKDLGLSTFFLCTSLRSVEIPEGITELKNLVFADCTSLTDVKLPESLERMGQPFFGCSALKEIDLPSGLTTFTYGSNFSGCSSLERISFPEGIMELPDHVVQCCTNLKEISFGKNVKKIGDGAFDRCIHLETVNIDPENPYYKMVDGVLYKKLDEGRELSLYPATLTATSFTVPDDVTVIRTEAFLRNHHIESVKLGSNVKKLEGLAFCNCIHLKEIELPESLEIMEESVFLYDSEMETITLPNNLKTIGERCFARCTSLREVVIPAGVEDIGEGAFREDYKLEKVTFLSRDTAFSGNATIPTGTTIVGYRDSTAREYCEKYGRAFLDIETNAETIISGNNMDLIRCLPQTLQNGAGYLVSSSSYATIGNEKKRFFDIAVVEDETNETYQEMRAKVDELIAGCETEYEKAKNIVNFVGHYLDYRYASSGNMNAEGMYARWKVKYGNCMVFTGLTNFLLSIAGIPNATIVDMYHMWGAAYVDGRWVVYDAPRFDIDCNSYDNIELITFMDGDVCIAMEDLKYLTFSAYLTERDGVPVKEVVIPDYVTRVDPYVFQGADKDLVVKGSVGMAAYEFCKENFKFCTAENGAFTASNKNPNALPGDLNGDGTINSWDVILLKRYLANWQIDVQENALDVNGDGAVTAWDVVVLNRQVANGTE